MQLLPKLHKSTLDFLQNSQNLLAFSAGVDSSALFFILQAYDIDFDLAMVDYNTRTQSKDEIIYAKELVKNSDKTLYLHSCKLNNSNFEHNARIERYDFFEEVILNHDYDNLITAHQLNDKFEWFLMQLGRGSGLVELLGMQEIELGEKFNKVKPLLHISKQELSGFLKANYIKSFFDKSNDSKKYFRNQIRSKYATSFVDEFQEGLIKSFKYLAEDKKLLLPEEMIKIKELYVLKRDKIDLKSIRQIDKIVKKIGILMSKTQRDEVLRTKDCVITDKITIVFTKDLIYISPFEKTDMPKKFKELCRIEKIPSKIRPYLHKDEIDITSLKSQVQKLLS